MRPFAYLAAEAATAVKRKATVYGLTAVSGLIVIFAAGYALNAAYTALMFNYGPTLASLIISGALLLLAGASYSLALIIANRPHHPAQFSEQASPYSHPPRPIPYSQQRLVALAAGAAGAFSAAAAISKFEGLRNLLRGSRTLRYEPRRFVGGSNS